MEHKNIYFDNEEKSFRKNIVIVDENGKGKIIGSVLLSSNELLQMYAENPEEAAKDDRLHYLLNPIEKPLTEAEQMQIETYLNTAFIADMMALNM